MKNQAIEIGAPTCHLEQGAAHYPQFEQVRDKLTSLAARIESTDSQLMQTNFQLFGCTNEPEEESSSNLNVKAKEPEGRINTLLHILNGCHRHLDHIEEELVRLSREL
ncbi:hypothetical protein HOP38_02560 [Vibrio mediterranei]|uniref:hypothetical protein n=1 Tax=Vibrio mediterranei TaxID=689 RepID=UPI0017F961B3|nr:hypothetical protein [Vibrio mediterranei]NUW71394.1 hypothetical protein [Vibrio mediterranei]